MPRVLPGPAAELNATDEKSKNENNRENAEANFPRRNYSTAQERLCDHSPQNEKTNPRFDSFQQFAFETVLRLIALRLSDSRMTVAKALPKSQAPAFDYGVILLTTVCTALLVPLTALCATFLAVIAVLFATFFAVWTGPA
jgi:hypothetical protein